METSQGFFGLEDIEEENTAIDDLETEAVNLVFLGIDQSISMQRFERDMALSLNDFKEAITNSKEVDEMLIARANFNNNDIVIGGYKKIQDLDTNYSTSGNTPLYDVVCEGTEKLTQYMKFLKDEGMRVKAVFAIFSDGEDTSSHHHVSAAKQCVDRLNNMEITTAFISFGDKAVAEAQRLGFKNIETFDSTASELRKAFNVLSKSVIEASKSVANKTDDFFDM
jgi:hypothetical protein